VKIIKSEARLSHAIGFVLEEGKNFSKCFVKDLIERKRRHTRMVVSNNEGRKEIDLRSVVVSVDF
jgi:hypothetical protein